MNPQIEKDAPNPIILLSANSKDQKSSSKIYQVFFVWWNTSTRDKL